jgi:malic enzyme
MKLAAADAILPFTPEGALTPDGLDRELHEAVAKAAAEAAIKSGCARRRPEAAPAPAR